MYLSLVTHERGTGVHSSDPHLAEDGDAPIALTSENGQPTVVLLIDEASLVCPALADWMRNRRAALSSTVNMLVIVPRLVARMKSCPGVNIEISKSPITIARSLGVNQLPGSVLLDAMGDVLWRFGSFSVAQDPEAMQSLADMPSGRISGAVALGDIVG